MKRQLQRMPSVEIEGSHELQITDPCDLDFSVTEKVYSDLLREPKTPAKAKITYKPNLHYLVQLDGQVTIIGHYHMQCWEVFEPTKLENLLSNGKILKSGTLGQMILMRELYLDSRAVIV